ncbi:MAG: porin family protein [Myxococcales bacterium]|nr:porin family protein [Myxococcales bacterium]
MSVVRADDQTASATISESKPAAIAPAKWSLGLGFGTGAITGSGDEEFSQGVSSSLQLGYRLSSRLRLQLDGEYTSFARFKLDPTKAQQQSAVTLGARWAPFEPDERPMFSHVNLAGVYLKGGLGVGHLIRTPYDTINPFSVDQGKWGGAVTAGLGWTPLRGPGYELGIEASDSVVLFKDEVRHNFGLNLMVNVDLF